MSSNIDVIEVRSIVSGNKRLVSVECIDLVLNTGDIVLIGRNRDEPFGSFDIGQIEEFTKVSRSNFKGKGDVFVIDNVTKTTATFKDLKSDYHRRQTSE